MHRSENLPALTLIRPCDFTRLLRVSVVPQLPSLAMGDLMSQVLRPSSQPQLWKAVLKIVCRRHSVELTLKLFD